MVSVISFYSVTGGAGRSTLALATAFYEACRRGSALLVDLDFEAPTQFMYLASDWESLYELHIRYRYTVSDVFRHILWQAVWRAEEISLKHKVRRGVVNVIPTVPSVETVDYVAASWAVPIAQRVEHVKMLRDYLEGAAGKVGAGTVIIDARSGLAVPSQDILLASDLIVIVTPMLKPQISRTLLTLTELFQVMNSISLHKALARYDLAKPFQAPPKGWISIYTPLWARANVSLDMVHRYVSEMARTLENIAREKARTSIVRALVDAGSILSTKATIAPFVRAISDASPFTMADVLERIACDPEISDEAEAMYREVLKDITNTKQILIEESKRRNRGGKRGAKTREGDRREAQRTTR